MAAGDGVNRVDLDDPEVQGGLAALEEEEIEHRPSGLPVESWLRRLLPGLGSVTVRQLEEPSGWTAGAVRQVLDAMERAGHVHRVGDVWFWGPG